MSLRRIFFTLYFLVLAGLAVAAGLFFLDARAEYNRLKSGEAEYRRLLAAKEARLDQQERELQRLRTDPAYVERVIRRNLRYAKPNEYIFNFEP